MMQRWGLCLSFLFMLVGAAWGRTARSTEPPASALPFTAVAYSPDGRWLAVARSGSVLLLDTDNYDVLQELDGFSPKVTALRFRPDSRQLAVAVGAPGQWGEVRLLDAVHDIWSPGLTLKLHRDLIQGLAYRPDGKELATASYDKLIKRIDAATGQETATLKDHSDSVYAIAYRPDGKLLASAAADRTVKIWDAASGKRLYTLGQSTDWLYTLAFSPDGKRLAAGGVDRSLRVWEIGAEEGKLLHSAFAHEQSLWRLVYRPDGKQLLTWGEEGSLKLWDADRLTELALFPPTGSHVHDLALHPKLPHLALARHDGVVQILDAAKGDRLFQPLPALEPLIRIDPNQSPAALPLKSLTAKGPIIVTGSLPRPGQMQPILLHLEAGEEIGLQWANRSRIGLQPVFELRDVDGKLLTANQLGQDYLAYRSPTAQTLQLMIRDREYRGGPGWRFRFRLGAIPIVTRYFPLAVTQGATTTLLIEGVHLSQDGQPLRVPMQVPADAAPGQKIKLPIPTPHGEPINPVWVKVSPYPTAVADSGHRLSVPGSADGVVNPGASQPMVWTFSAKKGQTLLLEVEARRLGSPLDSLMEILDAEGRPVPRAVLRSTAMTFTTLRDHDAAGRGIRIENWDGFAIDDYVYLEGELAQIEELPRNPDDDCRFHVQHGRRQAFLGTTAMQHALGVPLYKVEIHPPGTKLAPNGFPQFDILYRNDDGGGPFGKDSYLVFDPPADGDYQVRVIDALGRTGPELAYRLTVRPPQPQFKVRVQSQPTIAPEGGCLVTITAEREDEFDGPIDIQFAPLPSGWHLPPTIIPERRTSTVVALHAEASVKPLEGPLELTARAKIGPNVVEQKTSWNPPRLARPGTIQIVVLDKEVHLKPGGVARVQVEIQRLNNFKGRIPIDVRGLPHGVRPINVGLNGILITEQETKREFELYCEPWVRPQELPIVVSAKDESKNVDYLARSLPLKISPGPTAQEPGGRK